jgi:imidazolonepropionase-like amidohydrolase
MHVHLEDIGDLPRYVAAGVTTVRNMRGGPQHLEWRSRVLNGMLLGPTIYTSGPTCCHGAISRAEFIRVRTPEEADAAIRMQDSAGYDMVKVHSRLPHAAYQRLVQAARARGMPVVGHVTRESGLAAQLAAGQASLEHFDGLFEAGIKEMEQARAIARSGAYVGTIFSARDGSCAERLPAEEKTIALLRSAGVKMIAGSDASLPPLRAGAALHCELETLAAAGIERFDVLAMATRNAGEWVRTYLPKEQVPFGTITVGARADLVLLAKDPRRDIKALATPIGVVLRGVWRPLQ